MSDEGKGLPAAPESTQILPVDATPSAPAVDGIPAEPDTTPSDPIERTEKPDDPSSESVEPTVGDPKACEETVQEELTRLREENQSLQEENEALKQELANGDEASQGGSLRLLGRILKGMLQRALSDCVSAWYRARLDAAAVELTAAEKKAVEAEKKAATELQITQTRLRSQKKLASTKQLGVSRRIMAEWANKTIRAIIIKWRMRAEDHKQEGVANEQLKDPTDYMKRVLSSVVSQLTSLLAQKRWRCVANWVTNALLAAHTRRMGLREDLREEEVRIPHRQMLLNAEQKQAEAATKRAQGRLREANEMEKEAIEAFDQAEAVFQHKENRRYIARCAITTSEEKIAELTEEIQSLHDKADCYQAGWAIVTLNERIRAVAHKSNTCPVKPMAIQQAVFRVRRLCDASPPPDPPSLEDLSSPEWHFAPPPLPSQSTPAHSRSRSQSAAVSRSPSQSAAAHSHSPKHTSGPTGRPVFAYHSPPPAVREPPRVFGRGSQPRQSKANKMTILVYRNNGPRNDSLSITVSNMDELLTFATAKLKLSWAARRVFNMAGEELKNKDLEHGMEVVISCGEQFRK